MKRLSGSTLKITAIVTMLIDHIAAVPLARLLELYGGPAALRVAYLVMRQVGRISFPIFLFLLAEGFGKTSDRARYALRLGVFALISEIPFDLAFHRKTLEFGLQNVFFTLFLGFLAMWTYDFLAKRALPKALRWFLCAVGTALFGVWLMRHFPLPPAFDGPLQKLLIFGYMCLAILGLLVLYAKSFGREKLLIAGTNLAAMAAFIWLADFLRTDYSGEGILAVTAIYAFRGLYAPSMAAGSAALALFGVNELPALLAVVPAALYNGKRGLKLKYFFYIFYPAHLLLLWGTVRLLGM